MTDLVFSLTDLHKSFRVGNLRGRQVEALRGISMEVKAGTSFGFLGPNGAGKSTTIKILSGLLLPTSGKVCLFGRAPSDAVARRRLGYLPENPSFHDHLTGFEVLQFLGSLAGIRGARLRSRAEEALELVGLSRARDTQVRRYSKGMTQRLGLAQALLNDAELLILDEPMSGLDPMGRRDVRELIHSLHKCGRTIFFSTHIIPDVEEICDELVIIANGKIVRSGRVAELVTADDCNIEVTATGVPSELLGEAETNGELVRFLFKDYETAKANIEGLWKAGARVLSMNPRRRRLEDVLLANIAGGHE
jgi:ABC-2 type transport system ATP-binding protein